MGINIYRCLFLETHIQSTQYKIIHNIINCNEKLFQGKIKDSPKFDYCDDRDNIVHYILLCNKVKEFWNHLINWRNTQSEIKICKESWNLKGSCSFGFQIQHEQIFTLNWIILMAKKYI